MTYSHQPHTRGGQTKPRRRRSQKSILTTADLIANKRESILFAQTELRKAQESGNSLHIQSAEMILRAMQSGLATLEAMQAQETDK